MNKAELIDVLTDKLGSDRRHATAAVENVVDTIVRAVHKGDSVTITGFGVFEQRRRAARVARNPRTGETVKVKPTSVPAFRPGAQFKAVVSGSQRLPAEGPAVKRGVVASGGAKKAAKKAPAKKAAAKKAPAAKKAATKRTTTAAKKAPAQEGRDQADDYGREEGSGQEGRDQADDYGREEGSGQEGRDQAGSGQEGHQGSGQEGYGPSRSSLSARRSKRRFAAERLS